MSRGSVHKDWLLVPRLPEEVDEVKQHIAENVKHVTDENERYIRSYHSAFKDADFVFVYCNPSSLSESVWIVHPAFAQRNAFLLNSLSVAGREVHPFEYIPPPLGDGTLSIGRSSYYRYIDDPLLRNLNVNPRVPLSDDDIRGYWPNMIGVRILLVHQSTDRLEVTTYGWSSKIGGLRAQIEYSTTFQYCQHKTNWVDLTSDPRAIWTRQDSYHIGCDNDQHAFLRLRTTRRGHVLSTDKCADAKNTIRLNTRDIYNDQILRRVDKGVPYTMRLAISILGIDLVGKITKCYDSPSLVFLYPFGYRHDLSLITDVALPPVTVPPGLPIITGFEPIFDAALRPGCPLFTARYCLDAQAVEQPVLVQAVATQYTWKPEPGASAISRCLLWRSKQPKRYYGFCALLGLTRRP
ncbi:uncharacterized protein EV420DRAFT_1474966 [Desarmillaria tabescens]|uniref:Uncharacterized protein n=1 Tax=Armillaria tabescens TaxID=1929756 RepID=A0AA39TTR5_ARMTA|nr:uncharacterized protein EV420DRAFT_1474966 [Desarmillaria tabescens]KAK0466183.1 hypothetical protein EV420DRAFT_1474966 [Desarmillaria tabescens]